MDKNSSFVPIYSNAYKLGTGKEAERGCRHVMGDLGHVDRPENGIGEELTETKDRLIMS
jgi:hypothetical protein